MKSHVQIGLVFALIFAFWGYIFWGLASIFDMGLIGLAVGIVIALGCIIFSYTRLKYVIISDLGARKLSNGQYQIVSRVVYDVCYKQNIPKPDIYIVNEHAPHALSVGTSLRSGALIVTQGLVESLNEDELKAYVIHEMVHLRRGHHYFSDLGAGVAYIILYPSRIFNFINEGENVGKLFTVYILGLFAMIFTQLSSYRWTDYDTDSEAAEIHGQGFSLASALNTGMKDIRKHPIRVPHYCAHLFTVEPITQQTQAGAMFVSHLPTPKRVNRLKRASKKTSKSAVYKHKGVT
jgi:heat shock protein HtpX